MPKNAIVVDYNKKEEKVQIKKRAVIYARYSSEKQKDDSISQQISECMYYINMRGYDFVETYVDRAKSASHDISKRKDFLRLLEDSKSGEFDVVVAWALDRISREEDAGFFGYERTLNDNGVTIEYATQSFSDDDGGDILKAVIVTMASAYVKQLRRNVVRGMTDNALEGRFNGGSYIPIGFKIDDGGKKNKYYEPDPDIIPLIATSFEMYVSGSTTSQIAAFLNSHGVKNSQNRKITQDAVNRMLSQPLYYGTKVSHFNNKVSHSDITVPGACDAIISEELWNKVQIEKAKRRYKGAANGQRVIYELKGLLFCGYCGAELCADNGKSKNGNKYYYYACPNKKHKKKDDPQRCSKENIDKDLIEAVVMQLVSNHIWGNDLITQYVEAARKADRVKGKNPRIEELERSIKKHEEKRDRADAAYLETGSKRWLKASQDEDGYIQNDEAELKALKKTLSKETTPEEFEANIIKLKELWLEMQKTSEGRRHILQAFVNKVYVYNKDPDDPNKVKLKVVIRTELDSDIADEVEAEIDLGVRNQESEVHQTRSIRLR